MVAFLRNKIEFLTGLGSKKALLLQQELQVYTVEDLLQHYPFRYEDRSTFHLIKDIQPNLPYVQLQGYVSNIQLIESGKKKRLVATLKDETGSIGLVWFQRIDWALKQLKQGVQYLVWGKPNYFNHHYTLIHPELQIKITSQAPTQPILPIYHTTEKLKNHYLDSKGISKLQRDLLQQLPANITETIPDYLKQQYQLLDRKVAFYQVHFPLNYEILQKARFRLKFEELFYIQLRLLQLRQIRMDKQPGQVFQDVSLLNNFYNQGLPFSLTQAQKRVVKEIYRDLKSGKQMHRLLQGDVGSGKTIVAFLSMLIVLGHGGQVAMMAPTEILAEQHYQKLLQFASSLEIKIALLTGSTKTKIRKAILSDLQQGHIQILVGTHSLVSDTVTFKNLGLAIIDEQHRFGVLQRAKLWKKNQQDFPHVLVMSATPIPRTLAMTLYGDLDVSVIDQMPVGRKPVKTFHYYDAQRLKVFHFIRSQIAQGGQVYIVYPLIEESMHVDYKNLMDGYESICRAFPDLPISIIHGQMRSVDKEYEMQRFVKGETKIMVATTVIEVGVNVPNANVMVIENAERFGLAQLHQLRGRVGRDQQQAYCILMTDYQLNQKGRSRIQTLVHTHDGFEIADADLRLRGPGDLMGAQQSGLLSLKIADLAQDSQILQIAREAAKEILRIDPTLESPEHLQIQQQLDFIHNQTTNLGGIG